MPSRSTFKYLLIKYIPLRTQMGISSRLVSDTLGTRGFSRVRREFSVLAEGRHVFGRKPKPGEKLFALFARVTIKTLQKPETALEKSLAPRVRE